MKKRILIVDDEFGLADIVAEMLVEHGYHVAIAIDGRAGLASIAEERPDLVLLDVMMPVVDGPTMLRTMRDDTDLRAIPVLMMTALPEALPSTDPPLYQGVLHKPFSPETLFASVQRCIGKAEAT